nr:MAG TPA: hypothetical protein [Caudoviricetes sp.]
MANILLLQLSYYYLLLTSAFLFLVRQCNQTIKVWSQYSIYCMSLFTASNYSNTLVIYNNFH